MLRDPFALDTLPALVRPVVNWTLALPEYRRLYAAVAAPRDAAVAALPFERRVLDALDVAADAAAADLDAIPRHGPLIVAANHPHGILDGLLLMSLLRPLRPDVRLLTNRVLARIPELHAFCFFVDPFDGPAATARSLSGLRAAHLWLRHGGALVVFPAGEVAHGAPSGGGRIESAWKPTMARLAAATNARIVGARIEGANSTMFYAAGRIHPALRTALLAREFLKKRGARITVRLERFQDVRSVRLQADPARSPAKAGHYDDKEPETAVKPDTTEVPSAKAVSRTAIADEIDRLPEDAMLVESGAFRVYCAAADEIPDTLREIGRLREIAYRAAGEGTGRTLDLDYFDERYRHLFLWDREQRRVAGAYRIGQTDEIVASQGVAGLYTRTLFRYDRSLFDRIGAAALELGRSFVRLEYQKNYNALLLLWKGIGRFVVRHPRYRFLFGPVSISARYSDTSHRLLMAFLRQNHLDGDLAALVEALNPSAQTSAPDVNPAPPRSLDEINRLVAKTETDGKGVPVLLRQYLKLNARLIGFNVDPAFGDALDALMVVDLAAVDPAILSRYLGRQDAATFIALHQPRHSRAA